MITMVLGFMYYLANGGRHLGAGMLDWLGFWTFAAAGLGFTLAFLYGGRASVPRRYAVHLPEWLAYDRIASVFAALVIATVLVFVLRFTSRLRIARKGAA
jgi:cytochrome c oxidase subunit 1